MTVQLVVPVTNTFLLVIESSHWLKLISNFKIIINGFVMCQCIPHAMYTVEMLLLQLCIKNLFHEILKTNPIKLRQ